MQAGRSDPENINRKGIVVVDKLGECWRYGPLRKIQDKPKCFKAKWQRLDSVTDWPQGAAYVDLTTGGLDVGVLQKLRQGGSRQQQQQQHLDYSSYLPRFSLGRR